MTPRISYLATFLVCAGLMGYALFAEYYLGLYPCPLCVFQRMAVIGVGLIALLAALHNPKGGGRWIYTIGIVLAGGAGIAVAGRHVWLQNLPPDEVPACGGASLDYLLETLPLLDALKKIFNASGECAEVSWRFLSLSMPTWVLIALLGMVFWTLFSQFRLAHSRRAESLS